MKILCETCKHGECAGTRVETNVKVYDCWKDSEKKISYVGSGKTECKDYRDRGNLRYLFRTKK